MSPQEVSLKTSICRAHSRIRSSHHRMIRKLSQAFSVVSIRRMLICRLRPIEFRGSWRLLMERMVVRESIHGREGTRSQCHFHKKKSKKRMRKARKREISSWEMCSSSCKKSKKISKVLMTRCQDKQMNTLIRRMLFWRIHIRICLLHFWRLHIMVRQMIVR